jgi:hypothetical protein
VAVPGSYPSTPATPKFWGRALCDRIHRDSSNPIFRSTINTSRGHSSIMSTAVAMALSPAPHDRPSYGADLPPPSSASPTAQRTATAPPPPPPPPAPASSNNNNTPPAPQARSRSRSPKGLGATASTQKSSPPSA